jgi:hypothetical protein
MAGEDCDTHLFPYNGEQIHTWIVLRPMADGHSVGLIIPAQNIRPNLSRNLSHNL